MVLSLSALLSVYCNLCFLCLSQRQMLFSTWTQFSAELHKILNVRSDHLCPCIKNRIYNNFNLRYSTPQL